MAILNCPFCIKELSAGEDKLTCANCGRQFPVKEGIPDLRTGHEQYWCEVPQDRMNRLNKEIKNAGWKKGLLDLCAELKDNGLFSRVVDEDRGSWYNFVPLEGDCSVLDVGAGWGAISFALSRYFRNVTALDAVFERTQFVETRREQENVDNIQCLCGNIMKLPFADSTFDLVVMNGVFEWVGLSDLSKSAYEVQVHVLRELNRVLKPGGHLYIGIENRFGIDYILGFRDHHSGLKYSTLLPRFMADIYSMLVKGRPYRTLTHSYYGYKRLLSKTGFGGHRFFFPVSTYRKFHYLIPLSEPAIIEFTFSNLIPEKLIFTSKLAKTMFRLAHFTLKLRLAPLIKFFVTSYSIFAQKTNDK